MTPPPIIPMPGLLAEALARAQAPRPRPPPPPHAPRMLDAAAAAHYLALPLRAVRRLKVGRLKLEGRWRWDRLALDRWLDAGGANVPPSPPAPAANDPGAPLDDSPDAALARFVETRRHDARPA